MPKDPTPTLQLPLLKLALPDQVSVPAKLQKMKSCAEQDRSSRLGSDPGQRSRASAQNSHRSRGGRPPNSKLATIMGGSHKNSKRRAQFPLIRQHSQISRAQARLRILSGSHDSRNKLQIQKTPANGQTHAFFNFLGSAGQGSHEQHRQSPTFQEMQPDSVRVPMTVPATLA